MTLIDMQTLIFVHNQNQVSLLTHIASQLARPVGLDIKAAFSHQGTRQRIRRLTYERTDTGRRHTQMWQGSSNQRLAHWATADISNAHN